MSLNSDLMFWTSDVEGTEGNVLLMRCWRFLDVDTTSWSSTCPGLQGEISELST